MKRILVPLDGTEIAEAVIPDARMLAGSDGELILVQDVIRAARDPETHERTQRAAVDKSYDYLERKAQELRDQGVTVRVETLVIADTAVAIDEAARIFNVDLIACATHGRNVFGRLIRGGVAWRAMANSPVPVLLRHIEELPAVPPLLPAAPRILVPLDGSEYSETALPLAAELAEEWGAQLVLEQVIPDLRGSDAPFGYGAYDMMPEILKSSIRAARLHLETIAKHLSVPARVEVCSGPIVEALVAAVQRNSISHVVIASHGRTGLPRVVVGSVTDALLHQLHCPIIVIPALVAKQISDELSRFTPPTLVGLTSE